MKQENPKSPVPEQHIYQTGNTDEKRGHRRLYTALVVVLILLVGLVSVMGITNLRLSRQVQELIPDSYAFRLSADTPEVPTAIEAPTVSREFSENPLELQLESIPASAADFPQPQYLSPQAIYAKAAPSIVSVIGDGGSSSGVVLSECGYFLTNRHTLGNADTAQIILHDGTQLNAMLVGADPLSDLAVLDADIWNLTPVSFGDDSHLLVGDPVVAIGDPMGAMLRGAMTDGIISGIHRDLPLGGRRISLLQTNAAINAGNAGGPLLNSYGQVIGIHTTGISALPGNPDTEGLILAIPSSTVKEVVEQLLHQGYVADRAVLGCTVEQVSAFDQIYYHVPAGLLITAAPEGTPLQSGDILLRFAGHRVGDTETLQQYLNQYQAGDEVSITIYRHGQSLDMTLKLSAAK